jgi:hypothetical protein
VPRATHFSENSASINRKYSKLGTPGIAGSKNSQSAIADTRSARVRSPTRRYCFRCGGRSRTGHLAQQGKRDGAGGSNHGRCLAILPTVTSSRARGRSLGKAKRAASQRRHTLSPTLRSSYAQRCVRASSSSAQTRADRLRRAREKPRRDAGASSAFLSRRAESRRDQNL